MMHLERKLEINSHHYLAIIKLLRAEGANARIVGGAVRDAMLGLPFSDVDIATDMLPNKVMELLDLHAIKVIPTGIKFGTVTAFIKGESFEITTLRADIDCDGRHANVAYSKDFAEDAARRDFTINALSYCPIDHKIYDYFGGISDLETRKLVFIGDAEQRICEDYLRILRFFRFSCRYAKKFDEAGLAACIAHKNNLYKLSGERIKSEMDLLLPLSGSVDIVKSMFNYGILEQILPVNNYDVQMHINALNIADKFKIKLELPVIYAILFSDAVNLSYNKLLSLKFSRIESRIIINLLGLQKFQDIEKINVELKRIWLNDPSYLSYFLYASLVIDDSDGIYNLYKSLKLTKRPSCPVDGNDLLLLGYSGKEVGSVLNLIKTKWIESNFSLDYNQLINLVKNNEK